jgi:hypothetical protein
VIFSPKDKKRKKRKKGSGANLTIVSYNASAVNINNATSSLARFENKKMFSSTYTLYYYKAGVAVVNKKSRRIGSRKQSYI